ncbi:GRAM domain-containing protein [Rhizophagus diaphanus]|nr:GRAM domain-containing protein [Rhizophagus diaphanus] [Rhizophagus sp. MUCL 43196]
MGTNDNNNNNTTDNNKNVTLDQSNGYTSGLISWDTPPSKINKDNSIIEKRILTMNRLKKNRLSCMNFIKDDGTVITGYAMAHPKRNKDFHNYFKEIPKNEHLVNNFSCALQKEKILSHGMMFISLYHICFHSNILGWVTNIVIPFSEIKEIEKKMTAYVIPNAIQITTKDSKYFFASFLSRDTVYELLMKIKNYSNSTNECCDSDSDPVNSNDNTCNETVKKYVKRETICDCLKNNQHYDHVIIDTKFKGTIEKVYNLLYTSGFIPEFLKENNENINMGEWTKDDKGKLVRQSTYIKRLNNTPGIKTAKCYSKDEVLHQDFDNYVTVVTSTSTPDVPSGSTFVVKTRTCIMWADLNITRLIVTFKVEFTANSLLKSVIEKKSLEGQIEFYKELETAIRKYISQNLAEFDSETASLLDEKTEEDEEVGKEDKCQEMKEKEEKTRRLKEDKNTKIFKMSSIEILVMIVLILTLIFNVYVLTSIRSVNEFIEVQSGNKGVQIKFDKDYPLNKLLDELKRRRIFSISDDNFLDERIGGNL